MRRSVPLALLLLLVPALIEAQAADAPLLLRVERQTRDDLSELRTAGFGVVVETLPCLLVRGDEADRVSLERAGWKVVIVDDRAHEADFALVGLRPDSDRDAVAALGTIALEEENWVLLRVPRGTRLDALRGAKVFASLVPEEPVAIPVSPPEAGEDGPAQAGTDAPDPVVQKIVGAVDNARIQDYWQDLTSNPPSGTRASLTQGCRDAAAYSLAEFQSFGLPAVYQNWSANHAPNVVATLEGAFRPEDVYLVEGHLDDLPETGPAPGADDNASGSVNVLESARVMSCWGFRSTVKFLLPTGEEYGLYGSDYYADDAFARGENIKGVLNFDMIGWEGNGNPSPENLDLNYNANSQWLAERFVAAAADYGTGLVVDAFYCPSLTASDHYPFWQKGWTALCGITDNEGYCGHGGNYPYYHTSNDTIANNGNPAFFYSVIRTSIATLSEVAGAFKIGLDREQYGCGVPITVVVADPDLDTNPATAQTVPVRVWSTREPAGETLLLTERGPSDRYFEGTVPTSVDPPVAGDGVLSLNPGDDLGAEYVDALDCDGATGVTYTASAVADCTVPRISSVGETGVSVSSATIVWATDEPADSVVRWGALRPPDATTGSSAFVSAHSVPLAGLAPCTVYWYQVESTDPAGNTVIDDNGGFYYHFETLGDFGSGPQPCHEGKMSLDRSVASCADTLPVRLIDLDLNLSPTAIDTVTVSVTSSTETSPESLLLAETEPNSSTFTASIAIGAAPAIPGDGIVQASHDDLLTATYRDADDGTGHPSTSFATGRADCGGPVITDLRVTDVTDETAIVRWTTAEPADSRVEWGPTPALGSVRTDAALVTSHALTISPLAECGSFHFRVRSTDGRGNVSTADLGGVPVAFGAWRIPGLWRDELEASAGWTLEGEWQIGAPQGKGTSPGDPTAAHAGTGVLGHDLTGLGAHPGDYENSTNQRAASPVINASTLQGGQLVFRRWLNVGGGTATSYIEVKRGSSWFIVWSAGGVTGASDTSWTLQTVDISTYADANSQLQVAFRQNGGLAVGGTRAGWNVDRMVVKSASQPAFDACGGCGDSPSFAGLASAVDLSGCADGGVRLSWPPAASWGTGRGGTYAVYRSADPAFIPGPANRVAAGIVGTAYDDVGAPNDVALWYVVRAENDETCGGGPANGGVEDTNLVRLSVRDETSQPSPGDVGPSLRLDAVNHAHVRLEWAPSPTAARYRVERADAPLGPFVALGETAETVWEDVDELGSLAGRSYRVTALDACGAAGP